MYPPFALFKFVIMSTF